MTVAMPEGRRLYTKATALPWSGELTDRAILKDAVSGSERLRDAILLAKGIVLLPLKGKTLAKILPLPCETCGAPARPRLLIAHIMATVAAYYGLPVETMTSRQQYARIARPRQIAMFLACELTPHSMAEVGRRFHRDHTTVMHAVKAVHKRTETYAEVLIDVEVLRERLAI